MTRKYTKKSSGSTASTTNSTAEIIDLTSPQVGKKRKSSEEKVQPITKKASNPLTVLQTMYEKYKDEEDSIGPQGISKFCNDLGLSPDSFEILVLAWTMNASTMGYFNKEEFIRGFEKLACYDLPSLKKQLVSMTEKLKYDTTKFTDLYKYSFGFASEVESKKSVDLLTAAEMLKLILPDGPHTKNFALFLNTQPYKVINKDQWLCFLEFSRTVKGDLSNYDESEAWPLLLDMYVNYIKDNKLI